jgi:hypothetical protein
LRCSRRRRRTRRPSARRHVWDAGGTELWFGDRTAIVGYQLSPDVIHGPGTETATDLRDAPSTDPLTIGVCYFADHSRLAPAVVATVTVTDPDGGTRTFSPTLASVGDERIVTTSPASATAFTPPAGWCRLPPPTTPGDPGAGTPAPGATGTPGATGAPGTTGTAGAVAGTRASSGCARTKGVAARVLLASLSCNRSAGILRTRCAAATKAMLPPSKVFRAAKRARSAAALRRQVAPRYRTVAAALYDLYHAKIQSRGVPGYRHPDDIVARFRHARTAADVMRMLPPLSNALRSKDFERVVNDLTKVAGLQRCVAGLKATVV